MKKIFLMSVFAIHCFANQEEYFLQGNKFYQEHSFEQAIDAYQKIDRKSASVLFNMGNCFFYLDKPCSAIVYWRLADSVGPWSIHKKIDCNCALAYKKLGKDYSQDVLHSIYCWFVRAINTISFFWWQLLFLIIWVLSVVLMIQAVGQKQFWRTGGLLFLVCSIMICFVIRYKSTICSYALIIEKESTIRTGPADDYGIVAKAQCLDEFDIDERHDNWLKVHNNSLAGWICANTAAIIDTKNIQ